jgi:hypothetical protein
MMVCCEHGNELTGSEKEKARSSMRAEPLLFHQMGCLLEILSISTVYMPIVLDVA